MPSLVQVSSSTSKHPSLTHSASVFSECQVCNMESSTPKKSFSARVLRKFNDNRLPSKAPTRLENYRTALMNLDDYLPQPEEDRKIASKVRQVQSLIEAHAIYHFYHNRPLNLKVEDLQLLLQRRLFRADDKEATRRLAAELLRPSHRATFIRIMLARALIAAIDLQGDPATSLLPQEIVLFMTAFKNTPRSKENEQVDEVALCEWRRLGSYLLLNAQTRTNQLQNTASRVNSMVASLDEILCVFAEQEHVGEGGGKRLGNLRSIVSVATEIGVLLFGQPCSWELDWKVRPTNDTYEARLNTAHRPSSRLSQYNPDAVVEQGSVLHGNEQPESLNEPRKRKRRFHHLVRSQSSKEKGRERDTPRKEKDRPPLTASVMRFAPPQTIGENGTGLYKIRTGESQSQYKAIQQGIPQSHYEENEDHQLAEYGGNRKLTQRSRSEPHFTPIYQHESTQNRVASKNEESLKLTTAQEEDAFSFKADVEDIISSTARTEHIDDASHRGQKRSPETPGQSTHKHMQEPPLESPERSTHVPGSQFLVHSSWPLQQSKSVPIRQHASQQSRSPEYSRPEPQGPIRPSRPIVYFPALVKVGDEYGCRLTIPLTVLEPSVDRTFLTAWY